MKDKYEAIKELTDDFKHGHRTLSEIFPTLEEVRIHYTYIKNQGACIRLLGALDALGIRLPDGANPTAILDNCPFVLFIDIKCVFTQFLGGSIGHYAEKNYSELSNDSFLALAKRIVSQKGGDGNGN